MFIGSVVCTFRVEVPPEAEEIKLVDSVFVVSVWRLVLTPGIRTFVKVVEPGLDSAFEDTTDDGVNGVFVEIVIGVVVTDIAEGVVVKILVAEVDGITAVMAAEEAVGLVVGVIVEVVVGAVVGAVVRVVIRGFLEVDIEIAVGMDAKVTVEVVKGGIITVVGDSISEVGSVSGRSVVLTSADVDCSDEEADVVSSVPGVEVLKLIEVKDGEMVIVVAFSEVVEVCKLVEGVVVVVEVEMHSSKVEKDVIQSILSALLRPLARIIGMVVQVTEVAMHVSTMGGAVTVDVTIGVVVITVSVEVEGQSESVKVNVRHLPSMRS